MQSPEIENSSSAELHSSAHADTVSTAAVEIRRKRGACLSRRIGQTGNVFQHCKPWNPIAPAYGRFWVDEPGNAKRKRSTVSLGNCSSRSTARRKLREYIEREGINSAVAFTTNTSPATTFRWQAEKWIASLSTRKRKPVKPATIHGYQHVLDKWLLPNIGEMLLSDVSNTELKLLIQMMRDGGLVAKTIVNYTFVIKLVMASAVDAEGEQIYPRKWNHDFVEMPIVNKNEQPRPTVTESELATRLAKAKGRYLVMFALAAGGGLRIGELIALKPCDLSDECHVLSVERSIWHGKEQKPKTDAAIRKVDLAEPLARLLLSFVAGKSGYLFSTKSGRPLSQRNVLRAWHRTGTKVGLHALRRFRAETLRRACVPEDLIQMWLGHAKKTVTDYYAGGLKEDVSWRREWAERAGLRFQLGHVGLQNVVAIDSAKVA
jgi:integrase